MPGICTKNDEVQNIIISVCTFYFYEAESRDLRWFMKSKWNLSLGNDGMNTLFILHSLPKPYQIVVINVQRQNDSRVIIGRTGERCQLKFFEGRKQTGKLKVD